MECEIMAYCDNCGNFDESYRESMEYPKDSQYCIQDYQPDLYYYWDSPIDEDYDWRDSLPHADCLCEICFDILNLTSNIMTIGNLRNYLWPHILIRVLTDPQSSAGSRKRST